MVSAPTAQVSDPYHRPVAPGRRLPTEAGTTPDGCARAPGAVAAPPGATSDASPPRSRDPHEEEIMTDAPTRQRRRLRPGRSTRTAVIVAAIGGLAATG